MSSEASRAGVEEHEIEGVPVRVGLDVALEALRRFRRQARRYRRVVTERFEWDRAKARANARRHSVSFAEAVTVFDDPLAALVGDPDHSQDEERRLLIGYSTRQRLLVVT
jgi:hypothetical protein